LVDFQKSIDSNSKESRNELKENLEAFKKELNDALKDYKERLREQFTEFERSQKTQNVANSEKISELKLSLEKSVKTMQEGNEKKLEEMRKTVDEKLNETLEKRLGESFKQVSDRLEAVHKGLGEMQTLAVSVGDLKKVMSNVKSRGVLGEYQLQNIIEDLLTNEQYEKNVKTKVGSGAVVEFAIKMPHGNNLEKTLWLPIDSKFPKEDYEALVDAYDKGDIDKIEEYTKAFINGIKKNAKDIKEKYIDPPNTTEYGIMFLPYESLFGEVLRVPGLFEQLQKDYKITITGPTTLSALLNSLQMGFRTLAIEKRSSEVWDLLGAVKTEFGQFGDVLAKTKKKLIEATNVIDTSEVRTRAIERKLRHVQELPAAETKLILDSSPEDESTEEIKGGVMAKSFQKVKPIIPLSEFLDKARKVKSFTSSNGRRYEVQRIENEEMFFLRLDAKSEEEWSMNLKEVYRAYKELEDFATVNFKPFVPYYTFTCKRIVVEFRNVGIVTFCSSRHFQQNTKKRFLV
jgi:DNA recombination protein RmuC